MDWTLLITCFIFNQNLQLKGLLLKQLEQLELQEPEKVWQLLLRGRRARNRSLPAPRRAARPQWAWATPLVRKAKRVALTRKVSCWP